MKTATENEPVAYLDASNLEARLEAMVRCASPGAELSPPPGNYRGGFPLDGISIVVHQAAGRVVIFAEGKSCLRTRGEVRLSGVTIVLSRHHGYPATSAVIVEEGVLHMEDCKVLSQAFCGMSVVNERATVHAVRSHFCGLEFGIIIRGGASCTLADSCAVAERGYGVATRRGKLFAQRSTLEGEQTGLWVCEGEAELEECDLSGWSGRDRRVDQSAKLCER